MCLRYLTAAAILITSAAFNLCLTGTVHFSRVNPVLARFAAAGLYRKIPILTILFPITHIKALKQSRQQ